MPVSPTVAAAHAAGGAGITTPPSLRLNARGCLGRGLSVNWILGTVGALPAAGVVAACALGSWKLRGLWGAV